MLPLPRPTANVTDTPWTGLPFASFTITAGGVATAVFAVAVWLSPPLTAMLPALPAVPVAVNVTGLPVSPVATAVNLLAPAVVLRVQLPTVAIPLASVVWFAPVMVPLPAATANVTATPDTGLPLASLTMTDGGIGTAVPAVTVWLFPALTAICVAAPPMTVTPREVTVVTPAPAEKPRVRGPTRPVIVRFTKVALPDASVTTGFVPESAGPPLAIAAVTDVPA